MNINIFYFFLQADIHAQQLTPLVHMRGHYSAFSVCVFFLDFLIYSRQFPWKVSNFETQTITLDWFGILSFCPARGII